METWPATQHAVQLVGPGELVLNHAKPVPAPTGHRMLCKLEATGLCFSDLKLLKLFGEHARKGPVVGDAAALLAGNPGYVPGDLPTVPGHEAVVRIVAVGGDVKSHRVGERCLVQTDYRHLPTANSNAAFGYNIEGGLQEYVLIDERVSTDPDTGERFLIPVSDERSASAIALVEPWACVESSYLSPERTAVRPGGALLVAADPGRAIKGIHAAMAAGAPAAVTAACPDAGQRDAVNDLGLPTTHVDDLAGLGERAFDDVIYFGADKGVIERLGTLLADRGIINIVTGGQAIGAQPEIDVGRIHYGQTRWVGTTSDDAAAGYAMAPPNGEMRDGDRIFVMGAGGPMGQMHVIRNICGDAAGIEIVASDLDRARLDRLQQLAAPFLAGSGAALSCVVPGEDDPGDGFTYVIVMAPLPQLVAEGVARSGEGALIDIFAGIPAGTMAAMDLDAIIGKRCFLFGTSGSLIGDMKVVLEKVESGRLDTNCSVAAISGMEGAVAGIKAVEERSIDGKIMVYPQLNDLGLVPLTGLASTLPEVAAKLEHGRWTRAAEQALLATVGATA